MIFLIDRRNLEFGKKNCLLIFPKKRLLLTIIISDINVSFIRLKGHTTHEVAVRISDTSKLCCQWLYVFKEIIIDNSQIHTLSLRKPINDKWYRWCYIIFISALCESVWVVKVCELWGCVTCEGEQVVILCELWGCVRSASE